LASNYYFNSDGAEIRKLSGFIEPEEMKQILEEVIKDPTPKENAQPVEVDFSKDAALSQEYRDKLLSEHYDSLDLTAVD